MSSDNPFSGASASASGGSGYGLGLGNLFGGAASLFSGLNGNSSSPYSAAMGQYQQYMNQASAMQSPFLQAGQQGMGNYQNWLQGMQNPEQYMNNMMGQYQQSPWAQYQQLQSNRAGNNFASANGLSGSSPMMQQMQQNSANISNQDMNNWMNNVLNVNSTYGQGQQNLMNTGANAANSLTNLYGQEAQGMGNLAYGQQMGQNQDQSNIMGGIGSMALGLADL